MPVKTNIALAEKEALKALQKVIWCRDNINAMNPKHQHFLAKAQEADEKRNILMDALDVACAEERDAIPNSPEVTKKIKMIQAALDVARKERRAAQAYAYYSTCNFEHSKNSFEFFETIWNAKKSVVERLKGQS